MAGPDTSLPQPDFVERDAAAIEAELIAAFEEASGRTLYPAQVERLIVDLVAYRETLVRIAIQEAAKQNLVRFARFPMLDYLGEWLGVVRLAAKPARCTLRFTLAEPAVAVRIVPAGTAVRSADGAVTFRTAANVLIGAGETTADVIAEATVGGPAANGLIAGQVNRLVQPVAGMGVANIDTTAGGAEAEDDERLRLRVQEAPEKFTVAGSIGAYRWQALSVDQSLVDVAVASPEPGTVVVTLLAEGGVPSGDLVSRVQAHLSAETVRPLCDTVSVQAAAPVSWEIWAGLELEGGADAAAVLAAAEAAALALDAELRGRLGASVVRSRVIAALHVPGVRRVDLTLPADDVAVGEDEFAELDLNAFEVGLVI